MSYLALARKYRPQTFSEVLSQDFITSTLRNAIKIGRVSHAYLFTGPRGVGKTSTARIFAKALNCLNPRDFAPCGECENCLDITSGASLDVIEIDGASNRGVDEIRSLREAVKFVPVKSKYKIIIVDEVHMLTEQAFNALLKTLEEPPEFAVFIFATTDQHKIPPTILSRCQRYEFKKIVYDEMLSNLKNILDIENIEYESDALNFIIRNSDGCMRDALSILDQIIAYADGKITVKDTSYLLGINDSVLADKAFAAMMKETPSEIPAIIEDMDEKGLDYKYMTDCLMERCRDMLFYSVTGSLPRKDATGEEIKYYSDLKPFASVKRIYALFQIIGRLANDLKYCDFQRYVFEFAVFKGASLSKIIPIDEAGAVSAVKESSSYQPAAVSVSQEYKHKQVSAPVSYETQERYEPEKTDEAAIGSADKGTGIWTRALNLISSKNAMFYAQVRYAAAETDTEEKVVLRFPSDRRFQYGLVSQGARRDELLNILRSVSGKDTELEILCSEPKQSDTDKKKVDGANVSAGKVIADIPVKAESYAARQLKNSVKDDPFVKAVMEELEGEIERIEKPNE